MRRSLFLNKIWNFWVPSCCKRTLENLARCNKYSHMCRKPENSSSEMCHNEIQLERRAQTSQTCVLCHTVLLTVLVPQIGIPAAQHIASTGCSGDPATLWQQWQEKTKCISGGGKERNVLKQTPVLSWEGSSRSHDLCQGSSGLAGWWAHSVTPRSPQRSNPRFSPAKLCHLKWTLPRNNNKPEKQESCMYFSLLFFNLFPNYVAHYLKHSVFVYSQYEVICKNNVW